VFTDEQQSGNYLAKVQQITAHYVLGGAGYPHRSAATGVVLLGGGCPAYATY
jgi:hypothetical protein